jgi:catechol 2,3-dioxygenase-like lactoylglutathione lyase family enzyme
MIRGVHHLSLTVEDMDRMLAFYRDLLGFETAMQMSWEPGTDMVDRILELEGSSADIEMLRAGNTYLELFKYHTPPGRPVDPDNPVTDCGIRHFAFDVVGIDDEYERLTAEGIRFHCPPTEVEVEGHMLKATYFRDPEGNVVELQELLTPDNPMHLPGNGS